LMLLREAAQVWENALNNRFEAADAWRKVLALDPDDREAAEAVARLRAKPVLDDLSLLDGDLVVSAEDLQPSLPPEPVAAAPDEQRIVQDDSAETAAQESAAGAAAEREEEDEGEREGAEAEGPREDAPGDEPGYQDAFETEQVQASAQADAPEAADHEAPEPRQLEAQQAASETAGEEPSVRGATQTYAHDELADSEAANFRNSGAVTPVAGAQVLAHLVGEVAALRDDHADEDGRVSELERAAYEAAQTRAGSHRDDYEEPVTSPGDSLEMYTRQTYPGDEVVVVGAQAAAEPEERAAPESIPSAEDPSLAVSDSEVASAGYVQHVVVPQLGRLPAGDDDQTIGWDRELRADAPELQPQAQADEEITEHLDDDLEEEPEAVDLDSLNSIVRGNAGTSRSASNSRIPPPPPANTASRSAPPPPPKGVRPPPPPRRG
jgi:hypothetical protein